MKFADIYPEWVLKYGLIGYLLVQNYIVQMDVKDLKEKLFQCYELRINQSLRTENKVIEKKTYYAILPKKETELNEKDSKRHTFK